MARRVLDPTEPLRPCANCSEQFNPYYFPNNGPLCRRCHRNAWQVNKTRKFPDKAKRRHFRHAYGVELEWYNSRLEILGGRCAICSQEPPEGSTLYLDHDHATGNVRDLLCSNCNTGLGHAKDSPEILQRMIDYLKLHSPK